MAVAVPEIYFLQVLWAGMDYRTGPLSQSLCLKSLLCISYLWLKEVYFVNLLMALIECSCAVLENVHVRQGRRQCSQHGRFEGKADPAFKMFPNIWMSKCHLFNATVIKDDCMLYIPSKCQTCLCHVFIIFRGKSSVAIYNTIICLSYIHYRNYCIKKQIQLN